MGNTGKKRTKQSQADRAKAKQAEPSEVPAAPGQLKSGPRRRGSFDVNPLWQFLQSQYSMDQAFRFFGPYRGASILPTIVDPYTVEVRMPLELSNTNYVGTHFGGSLYSMCDPFYMFLLIRHLGPEYIVWDKSASIEFVRPGTGEVFVRFHIDQSEIDTVRSIIDKERKTTRFYEANVIGPDGEIVARVKKELYIRRQLGQHA